MPVQFPAPKVDRMEQDNTYRGVQVLRFVAALMVVLSHLTVAVIDRHLSGDVPRWINGHSGVDVFFVISGFVMYLSCEALRDRKAAWRSFALRRVARIVPLYWLATTLKLAILLAAPAIFATTTLKPSQVAASYLFLPLLYPEGTIVPLLPVGWTLNFEMFFYALCAAALGLRRGLLIVVAPILAILAGIGLFVHTPEAMEATYTNPMVLEFLAGMLLAKYVRYVRRAHFAVAAGALVVGLLGDVLVNAEGSPWRVFVWGVPSALAVFGAIGIESRVREYLGRRWLLLGDASYALYLVHTFIVPALVPLAAKSGIGAWTTIALTTLLCVVASVATYRYLEKPLARYLKKWIAAADASGASTAGRTAPAV